MTQKEAEENFRKIYTGFIKREGADKLLQWIESTDFFTAPASTRFHGSYEGGLAEHSVNVFNELARLKRVYPEVNVTAETAAIVALLHDLCKCNMYKVSMRNAKNETTGQWEKVPYYEADEQFCYGGHGAKSVYLIMKHMQLTDEEAVAINCHMGFSDRPTGDYTLGKAYEHYPLAWLLHAADESATWMVESKAKEV